MISIIYDDRFLDHDTGSQHPESPDRLRVIITALQSPEFAGILEWISPLPATRQELL